MCEKKYNGYRYLHLFILLNTAHFKKKRTNFAQYLTSQRCAIHTRRPPSTHLWSAHEDMNMPHMYVRDVLCCFYLNYYTPVSVSFWKLSLVNAEFRGSEFSESCCNDDCYPEYQSQSSPCPECHIWALNCTDEPSVCFCPCLLMCSVAALLTVSHSSNSNKILIPFLIILPFPFNECNEYAFITAFLTWKTTIKFKEQINISVI